MTKICLCMIVKNESDIIVRCLNAAKPVIDFISVCDTGSTDGTPTIIRNWGKLNNIPTTVYVSRTDVKESLEGLVEFLNMKVNKNIDTYRHIYDELKKIPLSNVVKLLKNEQLGQDYEKIIETLNTYKPIDKQNILNSLKSRNSVIYRVKNIASEMSNYKEDLQKQFNIDELFAVLTDYESAADNSEEFIKNIQNVINSFEENQKVLYPLLTNKHEDTTFKNFGHNRTQSFNLAKRTYKDADYCLLIDADMIIQAENFDKNILKAGGYHLYQISGNLKYVNIRLVSTKLQWQCVGVTHEYWDSNPNCQKETIGDDILHIKDVGDGGCKADKFPRDIRLLTEGLREETNPGLRTRYKFYLAQSYKDSGLPLEAIKWYHERINDQAWEEETWYAHYMIGTCYLRLHYASNGNLKRLQDQLKLDNKQDQEILDKCQNLSDEYEAQAIRWMTIAYNRRPFRVEPIMVLAKHYREKGMSGAAFLYAKMATDPYCQLGLKDRLFVEHTMYTALPLFEIGISAFYLKRYHEGKDACEKLLKIENIPMGIKSRTVQNLKFYNDYLNKI